MKGTVKWFDSAKGYGFITTEAGSDIFVHYTGINKEGFRGLEEGQNVEFEVSEGKKGEQAVNVSVIGQDFCIYKKILIFSIFHPKKAADSLCGFFYRPDLLRSASERYAARRLSPLFVRHMAHDML